MATPAPQTGQQGQELYAGIGNKAYTVLVDSTKTKLLLSVQQWTKVTLRLESAGPVAFGNQEDLFPLASGKGRLLSKDTDVIVTMVPQSRLYIASDSFQRVAVQVEPYPWLWEVYSKLKALAPTIGSLLSQVLGGRR